ncbi:NUDIX hydrolase [Jeotgalibaca caeni]|uniref:NUDIX hydrolase n=1 Tax=Jeotgalibaca caeni TaxID=3028623 RepID=UPI00237D8911|nr:CoA pyrophosphatase [Jeotgalibaca caeni]MDE1549747.1 CoA pyrophosphatase [Jeotgalibaca caeni]
MLDNIEEVLRQHEVKPLGKQRKYAVLLPLIEREGEWHILYEVRSKNISQPGETSFPGGAVEKGETYEAAAIRETMEELNIARERIKVLGEIDYVASEYILIHCFVGVLNLSFEDIRYNEEVAELFTVPLHYFMNHQPTYYVSEYMLKHPEDFPYEMIPNGRKYKFRPGQRRIPFYQLRGHSLWGVTASLTDHFIDLITPKNKETSS